jgi:hypothetical protein
MGLISTSDRTCAQRKDLLIRMVVALLLWLNVILLNSLIYAGHFAGVPADLRPYWPFLVMCCVTEPVLGVRL